MNLFKSIITENFRFNNFLFYWKRRYATWKYKFFTGDYNYLIPILGEAINKYLGSEFAETMVRKVTVKESKYTITFKIWTLRPGVFIGKKGIHLEEISTYMSRMEHKVVQLKVYEAYTPFDVHCFF